MDKIHAVNDSYSKKEFSYEQLIKSKMYQRYLLSQAMRDKTKTSDTKRTQNG